MCFGYVYVCNIISHVTWVFLLVFSYQANRLNLLWQFCERRFIFFVATLFFVAPLFVFMIRFFSMAWESHSKSCISVAVTHLLTCVSPLGCHSIRLKLIHFRRCVLSTGHLFPQQPISKHRFDKAAQLRALSSQNVWTREKKKRNIEATVEWVWNRKKEKKNNNRAYTVCTYFSVLAMWTAVTDKQRLCSAWIAIKTNKLA